ncbi:MAG: HEAT repeat domain-containing protein, partial [Actinomycetota bacterium]|nr:HEAT repeat domain-containing protein [Actinomycetota bacterium]
DHSAIPYCRQILRRGSWLPFRLGRHDQVRAAAALALGAIGSEECRSILQAYAADRSEEVRRAVAEALRRMQRRKAAS